MSQEVKQEALVRSKRTCCICNEFAGLFTNVHHIVQEADNGANTIENAVVLCLKCHGEVGHYNPHHPIGNKYSIEEVRRHRDNWWQWCASSPNSPPPKHPIETSPFQIPLVKEGHVQRSRCTVTNTTQKTYYDVWVEFRFHLKSVDIENIHFDESPSAVQGYSFLNDGDIAIVGSIGHDKDNIPTIWRVLYSLPPHGEITYNISIKHPELLTPGSNVSCVVEVIHFEDSPVMVVSEGDGKISVSWANRGYAVNSLIWEHKGKAPRAAHEETVKQNMACAKRIAADYDVVFALRWSSRTIRGKQYYVAAMSKLEVLEQTNPEDAKLECRISMLDCVLRHQDRIESPALSFWAYAIKDGIQQTYDKFTPSLRIGLVVDTNHTQVDMINTHTTPIIDDFYLPNEISIIYSCFDGDEDNLFVQLLKMCGKEAELQLDHIQQG